MAKISIQQAASALAKKGYRLLGPGPYDLKAKSASYRVVDPSGHTAVLTQEQVKELMSTPALKRARALSLAKRRLSLAATSDKTGPAKDATIRDIKVAMRSVDNAKETATKWSYFDPVELFDRAKQSLAAALAQAEKVNDILRDPRTRSLAASTPAAATSASAHVKTIDQLISKLQQNPARRDLDRGAPFIRLAIETLGEAKQHLNDLIEEYSDLP